MSRTRDCKQILNFNNHAEPIVTLELSRVELIRAEPIGMGRVKTRPRFDPTRGHFGRPDPTRAIFL